MLRLDQQYAEAVGCVRGATIDVERAAIRLLGTRSIAECATRISQIRPVARVVRIELRGALELAGGVARPVFVDGEESQSVVRGCAGGCECNRCLLGAGGLLTQGRCLAAAGAGGGITRGDRQIVEQCRIRRPPAGRFAIDGQRAFDLAGVLQPPRVAGLKHDGVRVAFRESSERRQRVRTMSGQRREGLFEDVPVGDFGCGVRRLRIVAGLYSGCDVAERSQPLLRFGRNVASRGRGSARADCGNSGRHRRRDVRLRGGEVVLLARIALLVVHLADRPCPDGLPSAVGERGERRPSGNARVLCFAVQVRFQADR